MSNVVSKIESDIRGLLDIRDTVLIRHIEDGLNSITEFSKYNVKDVPAWLEQHACRDLTIYALGGGAPIIKRVVLVEFPIFNSGNILQTLKNNLVSLNEQAVEIQASADAANRSFSPEEASKLDGIFANIELTKGEINRRERAKPGPYAQVGAKLVEQGYAAIPILPGTKKPGFNGIGLNKWSELQPSEDDVDRWSSSNAGVGVLCGPASSGLIGVDIDTDDDDIKQAIRDAIPPSPVVKVGAKGMTLFYRSSDIDSSPSWNVQGTRVCDLIGPGRQTLLPPTVHPVTGMPYRWIGSEALDDTCPSELPVLTPAHVEAIGEALRPFGWRPMTERAPAESDGDSVWRQLNNDALANLHKWVPDLGLFGCQPARGRQLGWF